MNDLEQTIAELLKLHGDIVKDEWGWDSVVEEIHSGHWGWIATFTEAKEGEFVCKVINALPDLLRAAARAERMEKALKDIIKHGEMVGGSLSKFSVIRQIATAAIADRNEVQP